MVETTERRLFVVIGLLLAVVPAAAQTLLGAGPDKSMAPCGLGIDPAGETRFYGPSVSLC